MLCTEGPLLMFLYKGTGNAIHGRSSVNDPYKGAGMLSMEGPLWMILYKGNGNVMHGRTSVNDHYKDTGKECYQYNNSC